MTSECDRYSSQREGRNRNIEMQGAKQKRSAKRKNVNMLVTVLCRCKKVSRNTTQERPIENWNVFQRGFKPAINICKNSERNIVTGKKEMMDRWKELFQKLLNGEESQERIKQPDPRLHNMSTNKEDSPSTIQEVIRQIGRLKNNKTSGK